MVVRSCCEGGVDAHDHLERAVIDFHSLKDSRGQLLSRGWRVATVGDPPAPPLPVDLPSIKLANSSGNCPGQR
jgi:hypothetical protein